MHQPAIILHRREVSRHPELRRKTACANRASHSCAFRNARFEVARNLSKVENLPGGERVNSAGKK
jgi:hypothetical protein